MCGSGGGHGIGGGHGTLFVWSGAQKDDALDRMVRDAVFCRIGGAGGVDTLDGAAVSLVWALRMGVDEPAGTSRCPGNGGAAGMRTGEAMSTALMSNSAASVCVHFSRSSISSRWLSQFARKTLSLKERHVLAQPSVESMPL